MLIKDGGLIAYASRKLKKHEEIYATLDLELVVVMLALKVWRQISNYFSLIFTDICKI
jgi:hypothetical protein